MKRTIGILHLGIILASPAAVMAAETAPQQKNLMEEVVVVASKIARPLSRVASQVTTFHRDDLDRLQIQSLGDIARYQPALETEYQGNRFGSTGISIRGIGGNRVAMELDGVPMPKQFGIGEFATNSRNALDPAVIERIEVLRGPASSLYGSDAIGGVVVIETTNPGDLVAAGEGPYFGGGGGWFGADNSTLVYGTSAVQNGAHGFLLSLDHRQGQETDNLSDGILNDKSDQAAYHGLAKWRFETARGDQLEAILDIHERKVDSDLRSVLGFGRQYANTVSLTGDDRQKRNRVSINYRTTDLAYLGEYFGGHLVMADVLFYFQSNETRQLTRDLRNNPTTALSQQLDREFNFEERTHGFEAKVRHDLELNNTIHVLVAGLEWDGETLNESRDGLLTDLNSLTTSKILPPGELLPTRDLPTTDVDKFGAYIQDEIQLGRWTLIPALRWDRYVLEASTDQLLQDPSRLTNFDENNLSAKFGATWAPSERLTLYGHYADGYRSPPAADVNLVLDYAGRVQVRALPNPDLQSEESSNLEFGLRFKGAAASLEWAIYHSRYNNFIESRVRVGVDPTDGALLFQSRNIDKSTIYGSEVTTTINPGEWLPALSNWQANLGFHWARGIDKTSDEPINSVSPAKTNLAVSWRPNAQFDAEIRLNRYNEQRHVDFSTGAFYVPEAATVVDFSVRYSPRHWAEIHFGLNNLTNRKYERYNDTRGLSPNDPRVEQLSRPGRNIAVTLHLRQH